MYGLKQSPCCWNAALDNHLNKMGFKHTTGNPCLYVATEGEMFIIAVYVNDILLAGKNDKRMTEVKRALSERFDIKDMGELGGEHNSEPIMEMFGLVNLCIHKTF